MKHSYSVVCQCERCRKEAARRERQFLNDGHKRFYEQPIRKTRKARSTQRRPVVGSAEWAETQGDDLGESPDY